jgi:hypothetical protein
MIFGEFYKISVFIEKKKNERKRKKTCMGLVQLNWPNCKDLAQVERSPPGDTHSDMDILHQEL